MGSKLFAIAFNDSEGNVYFMISLFLEIVRLANPKSIEENRPFVIEKYYAQDKIVPKIVP